MPADDRSPDNAEDIIARAKRELAERMFARMQEDDEQDEQDGVDLSDSSVGSSGGPSDSSDDWNLSGPAGSSVSRSAPSSADLDELASSLSEPKTATLPEGAPKVLSTTDLSSRAIVESVQPEKKMAKPSRVDLPAAPRYRPARRPAMAVLVAIDDGGAGGERVRVRKTPFDVGRVEGDLTIPHDQQMSRRHFRIERRPTAGGPSSGQGRPESWDWMLRDLKSLNGTYLRHRSTRLANGDEMLLGNEVIRVKQAAGDGVLVLTKVGGAEKEEKVSLKPGVRMLGADRRCCAPLMSGSPLLAPQHLRLECDESQQWWATSLEGADGVWTRSATFTLRDGALWQAGEQRFAFYIS